MDLEDTILRLQAAKGDPEKLTLATVDVILATHKSELRPALEAAAIPHWFDAKVIGALLGYDGTASTKIIEELSSLPIIETFRARESLNVHRSARRALRRRLAQEKPERFRELSIRAANHFAKDDPPRRIENICHRLIAIAQDGAKGLERLCREWDTDDRSEAWDALKIALDELVMEGLLPPVAYVSVCLCLCRCRHAGYAENHSRELAVFFCQLAERAAAEARISLGEVPYIERRQNDTLQDYETCKEFILHDATPHGASFLALGLVKTKESIGNYDVFLSYNSVDRDAVIRVASNLKQVGLRPWLDEWDIVRSKPWMPQIEVALKAINCCAVFIGANGTGPWQEKEKEVALDMAVRGSHGIVVVHLSNDPNQLDSILPLFLRTYPVIELQPRGSENNMPETFSELALAIMGERPGDLRERTVDAALVAEVQSRRFRGAVAYRSF